LRAACCKFFIFIRIKYVELFTEKTHHYHRRLRAAVVSFQTRLEQLPSFGSLHPFTHEFKQQNTIMILPHVIVSFFVSVVCNTHTAS
jgi:hypothetical protein